VEGPTTIAIEASGSPEEVAELAIEACEESGVEIVSSSRQSVMGGDTRASIGIYGVLSRLNR